jgi:hypothetical protein
MPTRRQATSPEELAQVIRVHKQLSDLVLVRRVHVTVTTANLEKLAGELRSFEISTTRNAAGRWSSHGLLTLTTPASEVKVNFLDVASVDASDREDRPARGGLTRP